MMPQPTPTACPFNGDNIPDSLKTNARWAPWKAVWSEKRGKYDKIPCQTNGYGLSTAKPESWYSYEAAHAAFTGNPSLFAGVGYVMTQPHGVVGIDLDHCVQGNTISDWAKDVIAALASYTELSPSGTGLRILCEGVQPTDWTNHEIGIEVYGGNEPRFLTVTGQRLKTSAQGLTAPSPDTLAALGAQYARTRSPSTAAIITLELPELIDELALPDLSTLGLPYAATDFLTEGTHRGDRSRELFTSAIALYAAGMSDAQALSLLVNSPHAFEVALDHRRHDSDRALMYLWIEHCQKARARAKQGVSSADDFDDVSGGQGGGGSAGAKVAVSPSPVGGAGVAPVAVKPMRFAFTPGGQFFNAPLPEEEWLVHGLLPEKGLGMLFGPSKAGKTFFALDIAMRVALGLEWRGHRVVQGRVAYICAEGGGAFLKRGKAWLQYHDLLQDDVPVDPLADNPNLLERGDVVDLIASLKTMDGLKLVVVDTLAQTTVGGDENSAEDMGRAMSHCGKIAAATGALVLLVGHTGKDEARGHRGWSGMPAAFDVSIQLEREGDYRAATIVKMKDGEGEGDEFPFHLDTMVMGANKYGEAITTCVVVEGNRDGSTRARSKAVPEPQQWTLEVAKSMALTKVPFSQEMLFDAAVVKCKSKKGGHNAKRDAERAIAALLKSGEILVVDGNVQIGAE